LGGASEVLNNGGAGTYSAFVTATATTMYVILTTAGNASTAVFDNVTVKEYLGTTSTGAVPKGLLIEEQRTNLLLQSENFSASWSLLRLTNTADALVSPDGRVNADLLLDTAVAGTHVAIQTITKAASSIVYTASVYLKAGVRTLGELRVSDQAGNGVRNTFNLTAGTVGTPSAFGTGFTAGTSTITSVGNGWYRVDLVATSNSATTLGHEIYIADAGGTTSYTGNGSGFYAWGAQLEAGAFATSYIPTVASQVTRAADSASMIGNNFARWYNQSAGSLFAEYSFIGTIGATRAVVALANPATGNYADAMTMGGQSAANALVYFEVRANSTDQANILLSTATVNTPYKSVASFTLNNVTATNNGVVSGSDTSAVLPFVTTLWIGRRTDGGTGSTTIKRIAYYGRILSTSEQQGITS
jgi:hypothetical protein